MPQGHGVEQSTLTTVWILDFNRLDSHFCSGSRSGFATTTLSLFPARMAKPRLMATRLHRSNGCEQNFQRASGIRLLCSHFMLLLTSNCEYL